MFLHKYYTSSVNPHAVLTKFGFRRITPCWVTAQSANNLLTVGNSGQLAVAETSLFRLSDCLSEITSLFDLILVLDRNLAQ